MSRKSQVRLAVKTAAARGGQGPRWRALQSDKRCRSKGDLDQEDIACAQGWAQVSVGRPTLGRPKATQDGLRNGSGSTRLEDFRENEQQLRSPSEV